MSVPRTSAGIRAHLKTEGFAYDVKQATRICLGKPIQSLTNDCAASLRLRNEQGASVQVHIEVTITSGYIMVLMPWLTELKRVNIDHLAGTPKEHDKLLSDVIRGIYGQWDEHWYPGLRAHLQAEGLEVGPYRLGSEFRPIRDVLSPPKCKRRLMVGLTLMRVLASEYGSKRLAIDSVMAIHGMDRPMAKNWIERLLFERPEHFSLRPGRSYCLTDRGYQVLHSLESQMGGDLPWPL